MEDFRKIFLMKYILKLIFDRIKKKNLLAIPSTIWHINILKRNFR
jgi:hypothetical protein